MNTETASPTIEQLEKLLAEEEWRPTVRSPRYFVSSFGRVRGPSGKILKPQMGAGGYYHVSLYLGGKTVSYRIAPMVAEAFLGPRPTGYHVAHLSGDQTDNALLNLAYTTPAENNAHKHAHGTAQHGDTRHSHRLTKAQVADIRTGRLRNVEFSRFYGVSRSNITQIRKGQRWAND